MALAGQLRTRTHALHKRAETTGVVHDILRGRASRRAYALFMRNLLPAYTALEHGLEYRSTCPAVQAIRLPQLYRERALRSDLESLYGPSWESDLPLLSSGLDYARRVDQAGEGGGERLIAHAYTRYLGDLNGGRILARILQRSLHLKVGDLSFYAYPGVEAPPQLAQAYRQRFDRAGEMARDVEAVLDEAEVSFLCNIALSEAVQSACV